ncbi:MAG: DEAD/DEAH box helicase [Acidimicrobiales bacterium]
MFPRRAEEPQRCPGVRVIRYHGATRTLPDGVRPSDVVPLRSPTVSPAVIAYSGRHRLGTSSSPTRPRRSRTPTPTRHGPCGRSGASTRIAHTGTPVQNQLTDLWAILDWTTPGLLGARTFPVRNRDSSQRDRDPVETRRLNQLLRPFLLRRRKTDPDIAPDLPPARDERDRSAHRRTGGALSGRGRRDDGEHRRQRGFARRGLVLGLVTRLKQVCNHPAHFLGETGPLPRRSGKLTAATELLEVIRQESDAALVFTQYVAMAELLDTYWQQLGFRTLVLHGGLSLTERDAAVARLSALRRADVFIISLRAGGVGTQPHCRNPCAARYDRWWKSGRRGSGERPSLAHRPDSSRADPPTGLRRNDRGHIAAMLDDKRGLADAVVGSRRRVDLPAERRRA